jgi:hypothetical protein
MKEIENYIPCAFINANVLPVKKSKYTCTYVYENNGKLNLIGIRSYYYKHPDAPNDAYLIVENEEFILRDIKTSDIAEYSVLYLLLQAQNAIRILPQYKKAELL